MLQSNLLFLAQLIDPDLIIFFVFGAAAVLMLSLSIKPWFKATLVSLALLEGLLIWKIALGLTVPSIHVVPESFEQLAILFIWHRWVLLAPVPILLATVIIILAVYRERLNEDHAILYRRAASFSFWAAFVFFVFAVIESVF